MRMMEMAQKERAETKKLIETKVGGLEEKVDSVVGTMNELSSKAENHEGALISMQKKMEIMEKELENLKSRGKEAPTYREVASREVGNSVAGRVRDIEVASSERSSEMSVRERGGEETRERGREVSGKERGREAAATARGGRRPAREEEKVKEMFQEANSTLTFSPMAE